MKKISKILSLLIVLLLLLSLTGMAVTKTKKIVKKIPCPLTQGIVVSWYGDNEGKPEENGVTLDSLGYPQANILIENNSKKIVDAFEVTFKCYDTFDRPVYKIGTKSNVFKGLSQHLKLKPKGFDAYTWSLVNCDTTTKIKDIQIITVHFTDGTTWKK